MLTACGHNFWRGDDFRPRGVWNHCVAALWSRATEALRTDLNDKNQTVAGHETGLQEASMITRLFLGIGFGLGLAATVASAQNAAEPVAAKTDWIIYQNDDPKQCWVVSAPQAGKSTATRDGRPVAVNRGDIFLFVSFWPDETASGGGKGEVSFIGGYDFAEGKPVTIEVGDASFELFSEGSTAWAPSEEEDRRIAAAMKAGATATVTGISQRSGTTTKDVFSLMGFTAAYEDAQSRCDG